MQGSHAWHVTSPPAWTEPGNVRNEPGAACAAETRPQDLLVLEVRGPSLRAEMDMLLHAAGHFIELSEDEKHEAGQVVPSERGLRVWE